MRCPSPFSLIFPCLSRSLKLPSGFIVALLNLNLCIIFLLHTQWPYFIPSWAPIGDPALFPAPVLFYHHETLLSSSLTLPLTRWPRSRSSFLRGRLNTHGGCRHPAGDVEWAVGFTFHLKDFTDAHTASNRHGGRGFQSRLEAGKRLLFASRLIVFWPRLRAAPLVFLLPTLPSIPRAPNLAGSHFCFSSNFRQTHAHTHAQ